jgi:hypothetical protein
MAAPTTAQYEDTLGRLAMRYRRTSDPTQRKQIAREYLEVVEQLISSGEWQESPPPEDQLPYADMPLAYFKYWRQ